jgi:hypothetical protein
MLNKPIQPASPCSAPTVHHEDLAVCYMAPVHHGITVAGIVRFGDDGLENRVS